MLDVHAPEHTPRVRPAFCGAPGKSGFRQLRTKGAETPFIGKPST
jgi:hypothetical protein